MSDSEVLSGMNDTKCGRRKEVLEFFRPGGQKFRRKLDILKPENQLKIVSYFLFSSYLLLKFKPAKMYHPRLYCSYIKNICYSHLTNLQQFEFKFECCLCNVCQSDNNTYTGFSIFTSGWFHFSIKSKACHRGRLKCQFLSTALLLTFPN